MSEYLALASQPFNGDADLLKLLTPLGQWQWALEELLGAQHTRGQEFCGRLVELRRFASRHWPGWFEKALAGFSRTAVSTRNFQERVRALSAQAGAAAAFEGYRPVTDWLDAQAKRSRLALYRDALSYMSQGIADNDVENEVAQGGALWVDFEADLTRARAASSPSVLEGGEVGARLSEYSDSLQRELHLVQSQTHVAAAKSPATAADACRSVEAIICIIKDVLRLRDETHTLIDRLSQTP